MASFPQASPPTPCAHLYPPPYALHALPISFVSILPPAQYWVRNTDHSAPRYSITIQTLFSGVVIYLNNSCYSTLYIGSLKKNSLVLFVEYDIFWNTWSCGLFGNVQQVTWFWCPPANVHVCVCSAVWLAVDCCNTFSAVAFIWEKVLLQERKQFQHVEMFPLMVFSAERDRSYNTVTWGSPHHVFTFTVSYTWEFHAFLLLRFGSFDDKFCHSCDVELCGMYSSQMITVWFNIKYAYSSPFGRSQ